MAKAKRGAVKSKSGGRRRKRAAQNENPTSAAEILKADHRRVESLFEKYEKAGDSREKRELAQDVCEELIIHTLLEEEVFYPACREAGVDEDILNEAQVEHDGAKVMIADLLNSRRGTYFDAKVIVLSEYIKHHVREEEKPRSGVLAQAKKKGVNMDEVGARLQQRKAELTEDAEELLREPLEAISLQLQDIQPARESTMPRYSNDRDRDDQGRFTSDDDDNRRYRSRGSSRSSRYQDDDDDRGYRSSGNYRERDDQGRFMSDDDNGHSRGRSSQGGYSSQSRSSRDNDDDDYGRGRSSQGGRGHGGWYGDSEGHSQAARQRGSQSRSSRDYDDDDYGRGRSSQGGRGHGGWFGDSEGHSEAAEQGWEHRGRSSSRSRYDEDDDDDRRYSRGSRGSRSSSSGGGGRSHGGWFGDPEGHSQASRRGWQDRD